MVGDMELENGGSISYRTLFIMFYVVSSIYFENKEVYITIPD